MRRRSGWLVLACVAACQSSDQIVITFGSKGQGLDGFFCLDTAQRPLLDRVAAPPLVDAGLRPISLVFDVIALDGGPDCQTSDLVAWCATGHCAPDLTQRRCLPLPMEALQALYDSGDAGAPGAIRKALLDSIQQLSGTPLASNVQETGEVLIRAVGTLEGCDGLRAGFDAGSLVGCAYSCPQPVGVASTQRQIVTLGFNTPLGSGCTSADVAACAAPRLP